MSRDEEDVLKAPEKSALGSSIPSSICVRMGRVAQGDEHVDVEKMNHARRGWMARWNSSSSTSSSMALICSREMVSPGCRFYTR